MTHPPDDPVDLTRTLVAIPSVNPTLEADGAGEAAVARCCAEWLEGWGYHVALEEVAPGRPNVVAVLGQGEPSILLNGHLDTVGVGGMTVDPLGADSTATRVVGRGACDMKAGLAAILATARAWAGRPGRGRLVVALTADEEHASVGMQALMDSGIRADLAVVAEPTSLAIMPAHKGFVWVEVTFQGRAAHGSRPGIGRDAIRHAAVFLEGMGPLDGVLRHELEHPLLGFPSFHAGTISGGAGPSVYPDRCTLTLERRTLPGETPETFLNEVETALTLARARIPDLAATVRLDLVRPPSDVGPDHGLVRDLAEALEGEGLEPRLQGMTAWVEAAYLNEAGIPAVCFGPGSIEQAHAADEWVDAEEIRTATRVLTRFVRQFTG